MKHGKWLFHPEDYAVRLWIERSWWQWHTRPKYQATLEEARTAQVRHRWMGAQRGWV